MTEPSRAARRPTRAPTSFTLALFALGSIAIIGVGCSADHSARLGTIPAPLAAEAPLELLPAAGLRWLITAKPKELLGNEAFCSECSRLLPEQRLKAFALRTGIDLRAANFALLAGYDLTTVYGVSATGIAPAAISSFRERLRDGGRIARAHPRVQRVTGTLGQTPQGLLTVGDHLALVTIGDLTLARVMEAFALGRLQRSPPALRGAALARLPATSADTVATLYVPGPFTGEWSQAVHGLLGSSDALSVSLAPLPKGAARFELELVGEFPPDTLERSRAAWSELSDSTTGHLLGLDAPLRPAVIRNTAERVSFAIELETAPIAAGLHAAVSGEVWQILNLPAPTPL